MEIERKFLINQKLWDAVEKGEGKVIRQGYFLSDDRCTIRVRTKGNKGFLTIKGKTIGISREEFEYEIPYNDAVSLLEQFTQPFLEKVRYEVTVGGKTWEVDEFRGKLAPLVLAEIELNDEKEVFELPEWVREEVSENPDYFNSNIVKRL